MVPLGEWRTSLSALAKTVGRSGLLGWSVANDRCTPGQQQELLID
jgi:hypothetical protein